MKKLIVVALVLSIGGGLFYSFKTVKNLDDRTSSVIGIMKNVAEYKSPKSKCVSVGGLPDSNCTPGVTNPNITQANIKQNICNPNWSTKSIRPSVSYTNKLKAQQIKDYGYTDTNMASYEEDHLESLEIGGSPTDPKNLWPEAYTGEYNARSKDLVENYLHKLVCSSKISLLEAQQIISQNWTSCFIQKNNNEVCHLLKVTK